MIPSIEKLKAMLRPEEGLRLTAYTDSMGHRTVGYGFNLDRPDAAKRMAALGLSLTAVRSGSWPITEDQAEQLLDYDVRASVTDASDVVGPGVYKMLPEEIQLVLADLTFNVGEGGLMGFKKMIAAVQVGDYVAMAKEMLDSKWAQKQVPARAVRLVLAVLKVATQPAA
jgi:GH24 family phage-related lysozyme (muramidase)